MDGAPSYPPATPEGMADLVRLLDDRGVELRVSPGGELLIRDSDKRLSPDDRTAVRHYRHALVDWLANRSWSVWSAPQEEAINSASAGPCCDRCGGAEFVEVPVHGGASVRRDCGRCGRTWGFPLWRGVGEEGGVPILAPQQPRP